MDVFCKRQTQGAPGIPDLHHTFDSNDFAAIKLFLGSAAPMALDKIVGQIHKLSKDDQGLLQLRDYLKTEEKELSKHKQDAPGATQTLDPQLHSLGYIWLLCVSRTIT